jgi:hypothetical protein
LVRSLQIDMTDTRVRATTGMPGKTPIAKSGRDRSFVVDAESTASAARVRYPVRILTDDR